MEDKIKQTRKLMISNLPNISAYSPENLCPELRICAEAREDAERFDRYCSGDHKTCPYKILTN